MLVDGRSVVIFSVRVQDFGTDMMQMISRLEEKSNLKFSITRKILLAETGIFEQVLSVLSGGGTIVKVLSQTERREVISRKAHIISKNDGKTIVRASSYFFVRNLPKKFVNSVRRRKRGIGSIIIEYELETFRKIIKIGYDSNSDTIFKEYYILFKGKVAIHVKEYLMI